MSISEKELEEKLKAIQFWGDKKSMSVEDLVMVQPGLARIMPEIGIRTWKLYYAAKAGNWPLAKFVGSSRVDLQACKLEYSIVSPK